MAKWVLILMWLLVGCQQPHPMYVAIVSDNATITSLKREELEPYIITIVNVQQEQSNYSVKIVQSTKELGNNKVYIARCMQYKNSCLEYSEYELMENHHQFYGILSDKMFKYRYSLKTE